MHDIGNRSVKTFHPYNLKTSKTVLFGFFCKVCASCIPVHCMGTVYNKVINSVHDHTYYTMAIFHCKTVDICNTFIAIYTRKWMHH